MGRVPAGTAKDGAGTAPNPGAWDQEPGSGPGSKKPGLKRSWGRHRRCCSVISDVEVSLVVLSCPREGPLWVSVCSGLHAGGW